MEVRRHLKKWKVNGDSASADDTERTCRAVETGGTDHVQKSDERSKNWGCCDWGDHPIAIQSMTNTRTEDVEATVEQILRLEKAGCEIIRCTVPTMEAAKAIKEIKNRFIFRLLQTFILIIRWQSQQLRMELIRFVSIRGISVQKNGYRQ